MALVVRAVMAPSPQNKREQSELPKGQGGAGGGAPRVPNLAPKAETLERVAGGGSVDHLEDVVEGDKTALNAREFIYASFFNRIKRQVAQVWQPGSVFSRAGAAQNATAKTWPTEVRVSLRPDGRLAAIIITKASGMTELDSEAIRSFRAAGPFPNPPAELVKNGLIQFEFGFFFEVNSSRTTWRQL
jgi:TonB family protein